MKRASVSLFVAALSLAWVGCGGDSQSAHDGKGGEASHSAHDGHAGHDHDADAEHSHGSAATRPKPLIASDAAPEAVVEIFLDSVREGDDETAAELLTDVARTETEKAGLVVQTPGTPGATYEVGQAEFPTVDRSGAHVKSTWTETDEYDDLISWEVIWILRKQPQGWRIAGMATQTEEEGPYQFLNFEQPEEMLKLLQAAQTGGSDQGDGSADNGATPGSYEGARVGSATDSTNAQR